MCNAVSFCSSPVPCTSCSISSSKGRSHVPKSPVSWSLLRGCRVPERHTLLLLKPNSSAEGLTSLSFLCHHIHPFPAQSSLGLCFLKVGQSHAPAFRILHNGPASSPLHLIHLPMSLVPGHSPSLLQLESQLTFPLECECEFP